VSFSLFAIAMAQIMQHQRPKAQACGIATIYGESMI